MSVIRLYSMLLVVVFFVDMSSAEDATRTENKKQGAAPQTKARQAGGDRLSTYRNRGWYIPTEIDADDDTERLLLLLPAGPLVIETAMTIDGKPFRTYREKMIDESFTLADKNENGKLTWNEALNSLHFVGGRPALMRDEQARKRAIQQYDLNQNGLVDRVEARLIAAVFHGGPAFSLYNFGLGQGQHSAVRDALDTNKDLTLSVKEIAAVVERLKTFDIDENDILNRTELANVFRSTYSTTPRGRASASLLYHLNDATDWGKLLATLEKSYGKEGKLTPEDFQHTPKHARQLDRDRNGELNQQELAGLLKVDPHIYLEVNLGSSSGLPKGAYIKSLCKELRSRAKLVSPPGETVILQLNNIKLQMIAQNDLSPTKYYQTQATLIVNRLDTDNNRYLEKKELDKQQLFLQQFPSWDTDNDGKVFLAELIKGLERSREPRRNRITVSAVNEGYELFTAIDANGDNRLTLREMQSAEGRIGAFDKNDDGKVTPEEIPGLIRLVVARGRYPAQNRTAVFQSVTESNTEKTKRPGPEWFIRMDRNGDGDVTLREFPGTPEQFKQLDKNKDGFIEPKEAGAAGK